MRSPTAPLNDPRPGDKLRCVWSRNVHQGPAATLTVEARIGELIATSSTGDSEIRWQKLDTWCQPNVWIREWEVLHVAE